MLTGKIIRELQNKKDEVEYDLRRLAGAQSDPEYIRLFTRAQTLGDIIAVFEELL